VLHFTSTSTLAWLFTAALSCTSLSLFAYNPCKTVSAWSVQISSFIDLLILAFIHSFIHSVTGLPLGAGTFNCSAQMLLIDIYIAAVQIAVLRSASLSPQLTAIQPLSFTSSLRLDHQLTSGTYEALTSSVHAMQAACCIR